MLLYITSTHVGGVAMTGWWYTYPSEKYEFVNGKNDIPYIMENEKCLKPPTR